MGGWEVGGICSAVQFAPSHFPLLCLRSKTELSNPAKTEVIPVSKSEISVLILPIFRSQREDNIKRPGSTLVKLLGNFGVAAAVGGEGADQGEGGGGGGGGGRGGGGGGLFVGLHVRIR